MVNLQSYSSKLEVYLLRGKDIFQEKAETPSQLALFSKTFQDDGFSFPKIPFNSMFLAWKLLSKGIIHGQVIFSFPESQSQTWYLYIKHWAARTKTSVSGE